MKIITQRTIIQGVANRWAEQYCGSEYRLRSGKSVVDVLNELRALDLNTATAQEVAAITGNDSWTRLPRCDECSSDMVSAIIVLGAIPDYDSHTAWVCKTCVEKAWKEISKL